REVATAGSLQAEITADFADCRVSLALDEDTATNRDVEIVVFGGVKVAVDQRRADFAQHRDFRRRSSISRRQDGKREARILTHLVGIALGKNPLEGALAVAKGHQAVARRHRRLGLSLKL